MMPGSVAAMNCLKSCLALSCTCCLRLSAFTKQGDSFKVTCSRFRTLIGRASSWQCKLFAPELYRAHCISIQYHAAADSSFHCAVCNNPQILLPVGICLASLSSALYSASTLDRWDIGQPNVRGLLDKCLLQTPAAHLLPHNVHADLHLEPLCLTAFRDQTPRSGAIGPHAAYGSRRAFPPYNQTVATTPSSAASRFKFHFKHPSSP